MRRPVLLALLGSLCLSPDAWAQVVTATATISTATVSANSGAQPPLVFTAAATPTPVNLLSHQSSAVGTALATLTAGLNVTNTEVKLLQGEVLSCQGSATGSVACDVLLQVSTTQPLSAMLDLDWTGQFSAGVPLPTVQVDVDNNGVFEMFGRQPNTILRLPVTLSGTRSILVRTAAGITTTTGQIAHVNQSVAVRITPAHAGLTIFPMTYECGTAPISVQQTFARGVQLEGPLASPSPLIGMTFLVIGFAPVFASLPGGPCVLVPSPTIVVPFPPAPVALGAALLGPQRFFTQGVFLDVTSPMVRATNSMLVQF
jgi:hypothetical protein